MALTKWNWVIELAPQYWGRYRYAIEVASALLEFGFCELGLQEVRGFSISANARVTRLAHRYEFVAISSRPGSDWMHARGWSQIEWQLTRTVGLYISRLTIALQRTEGSPNVEFEDICHR